VITIGDARQAIKDTAARVEFYRMWLAAQRSGATHVRALDMMGPRSASPAVETLRPALLAGTQQGGTIESVLTAHPDLTSTFESAVLALGGESGKLEQAMGALVTHFKSEHALLLKVWTKLTYPLMTSLAAIWIGPLPLIFAGRSSAYLVAVVAGTALWYGAGGGVIVALTKTYANKPEFVLARLTRAIATGVEAGLPLDRVSQFAAQVTGHADIIRHVRQFTPRQLATQSVSETFNGCVEIPHEVIAAMKVAEVSGDFSGALRKLADLYES
jgi:type II secretory pathway component PulF